MKYNELKEGDMVNVDGGFACMSAGVQKVQKDNFDDLFIMCSCGRHYLTDYEHGLSKVD